MERKVEEIFEYNGEWYQCVEQPKQYDCATVCELCAFSAVGNCELDKCSGTYRSDSKSVIFKKLEKVGEPEIINGNKVQSIVTGYANCTFCVFKKGGACLSGGVCKNSARAIYIEVKQNKENMEESVELKLFADRTSNVNEVYMEKRLCNRLKPFNLEAAKAGKPVYTRDGRKARIICFDRNWEYPIVALIECENGEEMISACDKDGKARIYETQGTDLMMLPEKKEGWVNLCKNNSGDTLAVGVFPNREEAVSNCPPFYLCTIKIEWEE